MVSKLTLFEGNVFSFAEEATDFEGYTGPSG
jgi:hypothetical protein